MELSNVKNDKNQDLDPGSYEPHRYRRKMEHHVIAHYDEGFSLRMMKHHIIF
jgi:hypothetical protein